MDGTSNHTVTFQTPPRILIPKLVKSRDGWKIKANQRKRKLKAAAVRVRDLEASRDSWRARAEAAELQIRQSTETLAKSEQALSVAQTESEQLARPLKKTSRLLN